VTLDGKRVLTVEGDISISENPSISFFVEPSEAKELHARVVDTKDNVFEESWPVRLGPSS
jgi:sulfur-oxidizing protein SoxY